MIYIKFQGYLFNGSKEKDFLKIFSTYGHGSQAGHLTWTI